MSVEIREAEHEYFETGVGQQNRVEKRWELGAEIDGVWVPFATVTEATVEHARQRAEAEQASRPQAEQPAPAPHDPSQPQTEQPAPDEQRTVSETSSTRQSQ